MKLSKVRLIKIIKLPWKNVPMKVALLMTLRDDMISIITAQVN